MKSTITAILVMLLIGANSANAGFVFGSPTNLGPMVNSSHGDGEPSLAADGLSLYFVSDRPDGYGGEDLWMSTRASTDDDWGRPVNLGPMINSSSHDAGPSISADGRSLYFHSIRPGGQGLFDLWVTRRLLPGLPWGRPVNLGSVINSQANERSPSISADGLSLYFMSNRTDGSGAFDLWVATRPTKTAPWQEPVNLGPAVNSESWELDPDIAADGLTLFFASGRPGGHGGNNDLWMTSRASLADPWAAPVNLGPAVNTTAGEDTPNLSADGHILLFRSDRPGGFGRRDLWQVSITPAVDLTGDGWVDFYDFAKLAQYWFESNATVDMAPAPFGDGQVEFQDLAVFAEYWLQEAISIAP